MRVLVVDQDSEMLEAVARAFEVDVATSKATCLDLLRANEYDVLVACERLTDGSGLELLSQVAKRWPAIVRILSIEPGRRALLRGKLGPFKLFDAMDYPIDEEKLEAALDRIANEFDGATDGSGGDAPARARTAPAPSTRTPPARSRQPVVPPRFKSAPAPRLPESKFVPLGTASDKEYRILPHDYTQNERQFVPRAQRLLPKPKPTLPAKAATLAADAVAAVHAAVSRFIKPRNTPHASPPRSPRTKR